ncbi:sigma-70 family RNA polymerase sigma factor [bacterium]|nr:sigma-70 family RNA polymerase sigma factor [bacterium]
MELAQDKIDLISRIIKNDRKYPNNEDLFDDFFNETCKRSVAILGAIESEATLETYLKRIVTTSIINVLKDSGRLRRTKSGYMSTKEVTFETPTDIDYSGIDITYSNIKVPENPEQVVIQKEILQFVADTIKKIDEEDPDKNYLHIYTLRYDKGMTQKEISEEIGISQSEISKRLYKLMEKVRNAIE